MFKTALKYTALVCVGIMCVSCSNEGPVGISKTNSTEVATVRTPLLVCTPSGLNFHPSAMAASLKNPGFIEIVRKRFSSTDDPVLKHYYWYPGASDWVSTGTFADDAYSDPALCINRNSSVQNLEVVYCRSDRKMRHYYRWEVDQKWYSSGTFGTNCGYNPTMVSSINNACLGNLEVVVADIDGLRLKHYWRNAAGGAWNGPIFLPSLPTGWFIYGSPSMAQTADGCLHVVVPVYNNGIMQVMYFKRNPSLAWSLYTYGFCSVLNIQSIAIAAKNNRNFPLDCFIKTVDENGAIERLLVYEKAQPESSYWDYNREVSGAYGFPGACGMEGNNNDIHFSFHPYHYKFAM